MSIFNVLDSSFESLKTSLRVEKANLAAQLQWSQCKMIS